MAVNLSFIGGAGWQFFDNNGDPLSGGKIYTYAAGTTTPLTTYTSRSGTIANANPIILDAAGRTPQQIWSTEGLLYKYVVADTNDVIIRTWDNIGGSVVASDLAQDLANTTDNAKGDALIGFKQAGPSGFLVGATARTVSAKLQETLSVLDFGATGNGSTDDTNAFKAAIAAAGNLNGADIIVPQGTYIISDTLLIDKSNIRLVGAGADMQHFSGGTGTGAATILRWNGTVGIPFISFTTPVGANNQKVSGQGLSRLQIDGNGIADTAIKIKSVNDLELTYVLISSAVQYGVYADCYNTGEIKDAPDNQRMYWRNVIIPFYNGLNSGAATCVFLSGSAAIPGGNTSLNLFEDCQWYANAASCLVLDNGDNNMFMRCAFRTESTTTKYAVEIRGNGACGSNHFYNCAATVASNGFRILGTVSGYPNNPTSNSFIMNDNSNGTQVPVADADCTFTCVQDNGYALFQRFGTAAFGDSSTNSQLARDEIGAATIAVSNVSDAHIRLVSPDKDAWGLNVQNSTGDLRLQRVVGTGTVAINTRVRALNLASQVQIISSNTTLDADSSIVLVTAASGNVTITLPLVTDYGAARSPRLTIRRTDGSANTVTVQRQGTNTLNGGSSETLAASQGKTYVCDATSAWWSF